ncbi:exodeoxyribonuclease III, partial [bacterium]|nr:exodeoxyribonuclease III [bacterium]
MYKSGNLEELIKKENPDILCIQEIRTKDVPTLEGYTVYSYPASKDSKYYGTAIYTKVEPLSVVKGFDDEEFDAEGRVIKFEFESFNLYNVYSPSGAGSKKKLNRKYRFYDEFTEYFKKSKKPVVICGDFNRMATEIDSKRPELMKNKSGFMPEEQEWFKEILTEYIDAFRQFHPEGDNYTWWKSKELKAENKGIRLDYFLVSKTLGNKLNDCYILPNQIEYDHAPLVLDISYCQVCGSLNKSANEFCDQCGIKLSIEDDEDEIVSENKLEIAKDKIILLDLNYTLIANSKEIFNYPLE